MLVFASSCQTPSVPHPRPPALFFKLETLEPKPQQLAAELWQDYENYTYLYADLYLAEKHTEVVQFVYFNSDFTVKHSDHSLLYQKNMIIEGGVRIEKDHVHLEDYFRGTHRSVDMPFKGVVLHPSKLAEYLTLNREVSFAGKKFAFIDWRSEKPAIDEFEVKKINENSYLLNMKSKYKVMLNLQNGRFLNLKIIFPPKLKQPEAELTSVDRAEFDKRSLTNFEGTQDYVKQMRLPK